MIGFKLDEETRQGKEAKGWVQEKLRQQENMVTWNDYLSRFKMYYWSFLFWELYVLLRIQGENHFEVQWESELGRDKCLLESLEKAVKDLELCISLRTAP